VVQEEELEPRLLAALAEDVAVPEDLRDALEHGEGLLPADEGVEAPRQVRVGRKASAHAQREADLTGDRMSERRQPDVVDFGIGAPDPAARDGDLVLAASLPLRSEIWTRSCRLTTLVMAIIYFPIENVNNNLIGRYVGEISELIGWAAQRSRRGRR
jgi:hypothetical protein